MFPQMLLFQLDDTSSIKSVLIEADGVKKAVVLGSVEPEFDRFMQLGSFESSGSKVEPRIEIKLEKGNSVKYVQLRIEKASDPFVAVHKVNFEF